ncbi:MAG: DUF6077 domain-containing protein, partial [Myxococcota bacterium]|nr:DUF6077 domain-containing protein [Myxococcota bacterium]
MSHAEDPEKPWGARGLDALVLTFATWTLLTHLVVWAGGHLDQLILSCIAAMGAALGLALWGPPGRWTPSPERDHPSRVVLGTTFRVALVVGALAASLAGAVSGSIEVWWTVALGTLGLAAVGQSQTASPVLSPAQPKGQIAWLGAFALLLAGSVLIAHRPDADDAYYINLVVATVGQPSQALLSGDTLHGYADVPPSLPVFRLMTWELFQSALSRVTGLPPLWLAHTLIPALVALCVPLAWARLAMRLVPRHWLFVTGLTLLALICFGDGPKGYGDFGLLRLQQGKSILLHIALPLCAAYGIEFAQRPSASAWLRLAAVQIASVGLSASGLWLAPVVAGIGLGSTLQLRPGQALRSIQRVVTGLTASAYPLVVGTALRADTLQAIESAIRPLAGADWSGAALMTHAANAVLGQGVYREGLLFAALAVTASGNPMLRRFATCTGLVFATLFFNPWTAPWIAHHLTGSETYFRVFWIWPLPLFLAALVCEPLGWKSLNQTAAGRAATRAAVLVSTALALWTLPAPHTLSTANGVRLDRPGPKLPPEAWRLAEHIGALAQPSSFVLAPLPIARWIPLVEQGPRPLMVRELYLDRLAPRLGTAELGRRRALAHL